MNIFEFEGVRPVIHESAFVHPNATVIGDVIIGKDVYVGPGAALRGDFGSIVLEDGCNVQESCTLHMFPGATTHLSAGTHVGHGAVVHGASVGPNCLIGMNSVVMDRVVLEEECIVGALTLIMEGQKFSARSLIVGNPGKRIKEVSEEMVQWKSEGTRLYQQLAQRMRVGLVPCEPLREVAGQKLIKRGEYKPWKAT